MLFLTRRSLATLAVSREGGGGEGEGLLQEVFFFKQSIPLIKFLRDAPQIKKRENVGIFPKGGPPPPPSPLFGNDTFV